jgi:hypothetical protein
MANTQPFGFTSWTNATYRPLGVGEMLQDSACADKVERIADGSIREKVCFDHFYVCLTDVGQKARVEIHRDYSAFGADHLRKPSRYRAAARSDLAALPTFTDSELCKRISGDVV